MDAVFDELTYCSSSPRFKVPYGAIPAGTAVRFTLRPLRAAGFCRARFSARLEFDKNRVLCRDMAWTDTDYRRDEFTLQVDFGDYVGLVWYSFVLDAGAEGTLSSPEYQLTVYDGSETVPGWFGRGATYQIFPDRFRRTALPDPAGMPGERTVHQSWEDEPEYLPGPDGKIHNRDFFGGSLNGIREKLSYLSGLGVETIYLCPVFEAAENHRYGAADYEKIDPMLGTEADFCALCREAHALGMHVLLDGVFNHTGFVSRYFNGDGSYPGAGAHQSRNSPYFPWYRFTAWPDGYESWWGIRTLPATDKNAPGYRDYIFRTVVPKWLRAGADGWRLDVADELPDDFVAGVHAAARAEKPDAFVLGEVWEDGTTKIAYNVRRRHLLGGHCDGLMNYPFRTAALNYLLGGGAADFRAAMETLRENYPPFAFYNAMNSLGTHDTLRALTLLGEGSERKDRPKTWRAAARLTPEARSRGRELLMAGAALQFSFPGSPTVYYGDEAGMEGFEDPFNRRPYPWANEDSELLGWYRALGALRKKSPALRGGDIRYVCARGPLLAFTRAGDGQEILCAVNAGDAPESLPLPFPSRVLLGRGTRARDALTLPPRSACLLERTGND